MAGICTEAPLLSTRQKDSAQPYDDVVFRKTFVIHKTELSLCEKYHLGFAGCLWNGGELLAYYVEEHAAHFFNTSCLELGCGIGLTGIALALSGAKVVLTDLEYAIPFVVRNLTQTVPALLDSGQVRALPYKWGSARGPEFEALSPPYDCLFLADCIYDEELIPDLVRSLLRLSAPQTEVYVCFEWRLCASIAMFFEQTRPYFSTHHVPNEDVADLRCKWAPSRPDEGLFVLTRNDVAPPAKLLEEPAREDNEVWLDY
eukprot:NODE_1437_length_969_cov_313.198913_g992_i0.p1 GENE.NODE_1437_length_969_cov_313.198913_g992_i0~~NODE_1437_length_969_cov_313.198913_g992_i0.p1  ORF type:complete len:258 (-),score=49.80 NODE_1437_length_969_cov_313.198913_g992_i0:82-855(-)